MQKPKTHFEQIPVEIAEQIAEEEFSGKKTINRSVLPKIPAKKNGSQPRVRFDRRNGA